MKYWLAVLLFFILLSCDKEKELVFVDPAIGVYFELFELEGAKRGVSVDLSATKISAQFRTTPQNIVGQCAQFVSGAKVVYIDADYWARASALEQEFVVFHELGHCFLGRSHFDDKGLDGRCSSIMNSGGNKCRFTYSLSTRNSYLDELFIP